MSIKSFIIFLFSTGTFLAACSDAKKQQPLSDTPTSGTIYISVDESFRPVIEEQIRMYETSFPGTKIIASYKSEADCFRDFFNDSTNRLVIVGRGLKRREEKYMMDSIHYNPGWNAIASDAIAVVVNNQSVDTLFDLRSLKDLLTGKVKSNKKFVFDGLNATSTVRFVRDSILKGNAFDTSVVKAVKSSNEVLDFVANNPNAVGFVGISWIGNPEDSAQIKLLQKVKLGYVQCDLCEEKPYVKPIQHSISTRRYPLVRPLCYIIKENFSGLGTGFISFLKFERGQLIFRRAYLGPVMDFQTRNVKINERLTEN